MSVLLRFSEGVREDIGEIAEFIARKNVDAALRFSPAVEQTLRGLAEFPGKGSPKDFGVTDLAGIRSYAVDGFPNHLVLYRRDPDGAIRVLAVTHGARDLASFLRRRR